MPCIFMQRTGEYGTVSYPDQTVVPDPNDQTFDHPTIDHQTFDDPAWGGWGVQRACMYRYQGPMRAILVGCPPYAYACVLVYVLLTTLGSSSEPYHIHMV